MSLDKNGRALRITNVTSRDDGIYKCIISNKYRSDYSIFNLTVQGKFMYLNVIPLNTFTYNFDIIVKKCMCSFKYLLLS